MQFAHYADVPRNVADEVKAKHDAGKTSMIKRCESPMTFEFVHALIDT